MKRSIILFFLLVTTFFLFSQERTGNSYLSIPVVDLNDETFCQVVVDREEGQYLGHPTTVLLEDGKTMLTVYPKGHGKGEIVYKRSFVITTYGHWDEGKEPYILSVRMTLNELDKKVKTTVKN